MIAKFTSFKQKFDEKINFFLLYGENEALIEEVIEKLFKLNFSNNIFRYDEGELLEGIDGFNNLVFNRSLFEENQLIIIYRATDKIFGIISKIIDQKPSNLKIIIKSEILEKKSKLRNFFEKSKEALIIPFYEDNKQSLYFLAENFFKEKNISISPQKINFIIEKTNAKRKFLKNELEKISNYLVGKKEIDFEKLSKLINPNENHNIIELVDQCLSKNTKGTMQILNENNFSQDDSVLITRIFLKKLKKLLHLSKIFEKNKNIDETIFNARPPIFWKEKEIIKQQLLKQNKLEINKFIVEVNKIELQIKKNYNNSVRIILDFILSKCQKVINSNFSRY